MKQAILKFSTTAAKDIAKFLAEHGIVTNLSYSTTDGFFNTNIICIICFKDDQEDKVKANLTKYIQA